MSNWVPPDEKPLLGVKVPRYVYRIVTCVHGLPDPALVRFIVSVREPRIEEYLEADAKRARGEAIEVRRVDACFVEGLISGTSGYYMEDLKTIPTPGSMLRIEEKDG